MNRTTLLEHLENDTLPDNLRARFVAWCVIEQALPALAEMLSETSLAGAGVALGHANDLNTISQLTSAIKHRAKELAGHGKTGTDRTPTATGCERGGLLRRACMWLARACL